VHCGNLIALLIEFWICIIGCYSDTVRWKTLSCQIMRDTNPTSEVVSVHSKKYARSKPEQFEPMDRMYFVIQYILCDINCFVSIYTEEFKWSTVAMLAVSNSTDAADPLDTACPLPRLQQICDDL